jgi:hypothetical protein
MISICPLLLSPATLGQPYSDPDAPQLVATGGTAPYTWSVSVGSLPPGLALSSGGVIAGVPVVADQYQFAATEQYPTVANPCTFTVTATDAHAVTGSLQYTLPVGLFSEDETISVYEMLGAVYPSDYYVLMDAQGSRYLRIGNIASNAWGGIRLVINCYLAQMSRGQARRLREHIEEWDRIKLVAQRQNNGSVDGITGITHDWEEKRKLLLALVKTILPVITRAEYEAKEQRGGPRDSVGSISAGPGRGGGVRLER